MKQNGIIDKLRQKFLGEHKFDQDISKIQVEDIYVTFKKHSVRV